LADVENWIFGEPSASQSGPDFCTQICWMLSAIFHRREIGYAAKHVAMFSAGVDALVRLPGLLSFLPVSPIIHPALAGSCRCMEYQWHLN